MCPFSPVFTRYEINGHTYRMEGLFLFILQPIFLVCKKYTEAIFHQEKEPKCVLWHCIICNQIWWPQNKNKCKQPHPFQFAGCPKRCWCYYGSNASLGHPSLLTYLLFLANQLRSHKRIFTFLLFDWCWVVICVWVRSISLNYDHSVWVLL